MKTPKPFFFSFLLFVHLQIFAQVQWYQNQDAHIQLPSTTVATMVKPFTANSFLACYLWSTNDNANTWKISKSQTNGLELKNFYTTANSSNVEFKTGCNNSVYVFERSFTAEGLPKYKVYKLDAQLHLENQRTLVFPDGLSIFNMGCFEIDESGNIYFAGDGQRTKPDGTTEPASFLLKTNKNLATLWQKMEITETSFSRLHIDRWGRVLVIEDSYLFFPEIRIRRYAYNGLALPSFSVPTDINRNSLFTTLDDDDNILVYGSKYINDSTQSVYLKRISRFNGQAAYSKTYFTAMTSQLIDLKMDNNGNVFTLVNQAFQPDVYKTRVSRLNVSNGNVVWNYMVNSSQDNSYPSKMIMGQNDRFYVLGDKIIGSNFSRSFALRMKKNGQFDGLFSGPDSVAFQRSHSLTDGLMDYNNQLIAIGNTWDLDTVSYSSSYFRSFAVRFGTSNGCNARPGDEEGGDAVSAEEEVFEVQQEKLIEELDTRLLVYPNPAQNELRVSRPDLEEFNRAEIYNMQGALVSRLAINSTEISIDVRRLANGTYLLLLRSSDPSKDKKIKFVIRK